MSTTDEVRQYVYGALMESCPTAEQTAAAADCIMCLLRVVCMNEDTYHLFVGYLNNLRLEAASSEASDPESS